MKVLLVAGGKPEYWPHLEDQYDFYVGIDRGSLYLLEKGYPLDLAVGDFDSLSPSEQKTVFDAAKEVKRSPAEKDDTDTQLGLAAALEKFPKAEILLIGATGGRLDHFLANLWLGVEPRFAPFLSQLTLADRQNHLRYLTPGEYVIRKIPGMTYLAYCCLTPVDHLTLTGSRYTLLNHHVAVPTSFASNEFLTKTAQIAFDSGIIAVIQSHD